MSYLQSWPWKDLEVLCWFQGGSVSGREASPNLPGGPRTASALSSSPRAKWLVGWALMMAKDHALWNFLRIFALVFHDLAFLWRKKELGLGLHQKKCCHVGRIKLMTWMALFHQFTDKNSKQTSHAWKCGNFLQQESVSFNGFSFFFLGESSKVGTIENLRISVGAAQMASDCHSQVWWMAPKFGGWYHGRKTPCDLICLP